MASSLRQGGTSFTFLPLIPQQGPGQLIQFRAHISNIANSYSPQWGEFMDMGRADPKFMYMQYSRTINVSFMTVATTSGEHFDWMDALNSLIEMTKPIYKPNQGFNGIYTKMKIGGFMDEIGMITNFDMDIDNEIPWIDDIPIYTYCNLSFRVIGDKKHDYRKNKGDLNTGNFGPGKAN